MAELLVSDTFATDIDGDNGRHTRGQMSPSQALFSVPSFNYACGDDNPRMAKDLKREALAATIHARIKQRAEELHAPLQAVSRGADLDKTYLKVLFKRPNAIPKDEALRGLARSLLTTVEWLRGEPDAPKPELPDHLKPLLAMNPEDAAAHPAPMEAISEKVVISPAVLAALATPLPPATGFVPPAIMKGDVRGANIEFPAIASLPTDVPVYGTAAGSFSHGAFQFEGGVVDYVRRPPGLAGTRTVYSLFVEGSSMSPQHNHNDLRFVDTERKPRAGDSVIVQVKNHEHGQIEAYIAHYLKKSSTTLFLGKLNPQATIQIKLEYVIAVHKVLTLNEMFGI